MEPIVELEYIKGNQNKLDNYDVLIIPGTKNTTVDLDYLKREGIDIKIKEAAQKGIEIIGICGGYQILGNKLMDPQKTEGELEEMEGLSLLDMNTEFSRGKDTYQIEADAILKDDYFFTPKDGVIEGYEIHMGKSELGEKASSLFNIKNRSGQSCDIKDGAVSNQLDVWGTYIHGIFDNDNFRNHFLNHLLSKKDKEAGIDVINFKEKRKQAMDRLAEEVENNLNMKLLYEILGIEVN
jgi:adenosylcobyric acid synthase